MWQVIKRFFNKPVITPEKKFEPTGRCPVCHIPCQLRFTSGKGMPYESCDQHQIDALLLICRQRNYSVISKI